ncbi:hypothetical protein GF386_03960 [Candidatus Pacearchaeota archaeon]|nr:hypothetical protein [Candidatus Pacearchaeota archaeon]MBD3283304.1 hypothetical protein [Candidatus Pacearchaeota archaeon]
MKPLNNPNKKRIIRQLEQQFGINNIPYLFLEFGKDKFRLYSGNLSKEELKLLDRELRIETIGLYFAKQQNDGIRLTLDSLTVFKNQITKNILELTDSQAENWLKGRELLIKIDNNFKILKNKNDIIGCGKSTGEKIANFIPKERRIKN